MQTYRQVGDALVFLDKDGVMNPALATSWTQIDNTTWEFKLRAGVKFSNGEDFTAEDVKFTYDRIQASPQKLTQSTRIVTLDSTEVVDPLTVRFHLKQPDPIWPGRTFSILISPQDYVKQVGDEQFGLKPVGTGPFVVKEFKADQSLSLDAWTGSWRGVPKAQHLDLSLVPEPAVRVTALQNGQLDAIRDPPLDLISQLQADNFRVDALPRWTVNLLEFGGQPILDDNLVRQALNYAVDKKAIADRVYFGYAKPAPGQMAPEGVFGYNPDIQAYPYDVEKAKQLLDQAGWVLPAGGSIRMKDGQPLHLRAEYAAGDAFNLGEGATTQAVAQFLKDVGVDVELIESERADYLPRLVGPGERVELSHGGWNSVPTPDADFVYSNFSCKERPDRNHACSPNNQKFEDLYAQQKAETSADARAAIWKQITEFLYQRPVGIILVQPFEIYVYGPQVVGNVYNHPAREELMDFITTSQ